MNSPTLNLGPVMNPEIAKPTGCIFKIRRLFGLCGLLALAVGGAAGASAPESTAPEYQVKATFLYTFAKLATWPTNAFPGPNATNFTIGIVGHDPFGPYLEAAVRDKTIAGQPIIIVHFLTVDEVKACQLLFLPLMDHDQLRAARLVRLVNQPILTVGDAPGFARQGGTIAFVKVRDTIRFEVNQAAASQAGLKLSSKLLRSAVLIPLEPKQKPKSP